MGMKGEEPCPIYHRVVLRAKWADGMHFKRNDGCKSKLWGGIDTGYL